MNRTILTVAGVLSASSLLLVDSAIKGTVLLVLATVVTLFLRRDSAATRHLVWLLAIVAMLMVPVLSAILPQWRVLPAWMSSSRPDVVAVSPPSIAKSTGGVIESPRMAEPVEVEPPIVTVDQQVAALPDTRPALVMPDAVPAPAVRSWNWINALPLVWVIGFAVLMLRLSAARWMLWNSERLATVIRGRVAPQLVAESRSDSATANDPIVMAMESICSQLGNGQPVTLLIHPDKTIPVVWGILRCRLMLPAAARQWSDEQLQSVLLHELAHVKRRDTIVQLLAQVACALHWFNPLVWFAAWRLDVERERSCDDLVLASGIRPSAYAGHLLDVVTGLSPARWTQACGLAMARKSSLEGRLTAVLGKDLNRRDVSVALAGLALAIAVGVAVPISMLRAADEKWNPHQVAHIGTNDFSAYCVDGGKDASFVIAYHGDFGSANESVTNPETRTWTDSGTITAKKPSIALSFHRTNTAPGKLSITTAPAEARDLSKPAPPRREFGQKEYDLAKGRVFLLSDNGNVRQLDIATPVVTDQASAKKLAALIAAVPPQDREDVALTPNHTGKLAPETIAKLKWGEPVNGLRMALAYPPALGDAMLGKEPYFQLVVQNVSKKEVHFIASDTAPNPRKILFREGERIVQALFDAEVSAADWKLQPGQCGVLRLFTKEERDKDYTFPSSAIESDLSKIGRYHAIVEMEIATAPAGVWTGKLITGPTRGSADVAAAPAPMHKDARAYYEVWQRYARANGDIPGALVGELAATVRQFIKYNPTWETVPKLNEMLPRLDATHDWKPADAIALLDEVAGIQDSPLKMAPWKGTRHTIRKGDALPKTFADAPWGEAQPNGLRAAWVLEPNATEHRIGAALKARLLVQNTGSISVVLQVPTWHQGGVKARDAKGKEVEASGLEWTTLAQLVPVRLAPGEYIEINTPGIGFGPRAGMGPWAGPRVGSNVLAKPGDELTLTHSLVPLDGSEVGVSEDDPHVSGPGWWLAHVRSRLNRELPLPADAAERTRLLDRAVRELFATAPSAEETTAFIADMTPDALDALAKRLVARVDVVSFSGKLPTAPAKFRVLDADANADKQPRVVLGPGEYPLPSATADRGNATLKIIGRPVGDRRTNDAQILFEATEATGKLPPEPHKLEVPDGWGTWAIVCRPDSGVFYLLSKGTVRKIDYSAPRKVTDATAIDLPAEFRDEVKRILDIHEFSAAQQAEIFEKPAAPAATPDSKTGANLPAKDEAQPTSESPKTTEKEPFTAWGKEVGGLQAGLGFKAGQKRAYHTGETVTLVVRARNVGKEEVKFQYLRPFFYDNSPNVTDGEGKPVSLGRIFIGLTKRHIPREANLAAGEEIELYELKLEIGSGNETGLDLPKFPTIFGTGKFQFQYEKVLGNSSSVSIKIDPALSKLATGKLELEIMPAAPLQQEAPKPGAQLKPATELKQNDEAKTKLGDLNLECNWEGEKDGVKVQLVFQWISEHQQARWEVEQRRSDIAADMSVVIEPNGSEAKLVFRKGLEGEAIQGRLTPSVNGTLRLEIFPNPNVKDPGYPSVKDLVLKRTAQRGAKVRPITEQKLKWGEPVNGLRMALAWPPSLGEPCMGDAEEFYLVVQNVSQAAVRLTTGTTAPNPRRLNLMRRLNPNDETILSSRTVDDVPVPGDWLLQPRESALVRLIHSDEKMKDGRTFSAVKEHIVSVQPQYSYTADMTIEKAPAGAWTGKLTTGETRGSADVPPPKSGVPLAEQTWPMPPWGAEKDGLSAGIRIIGEARIGGEVKAELWVRNSGTKDVTFSQCPRADFGLHVVTQDKDGKEHSADITQFHGYPVLTRLLLPAGNIVKLKEFTIKLGAKKDGERVNLDLPPGEYKLRAVWSDSTSRVAPEGEWTGKLTTGDVDFKLAAANKGADAGKPAAKPPGANIVTVPDDQYVKSGFPKDALVGEGVMWNDVQNGLSLGYRITGDEWRILGKEVKVELWVRNPGDRDVKFQLNMRPDIGLRMTMKGEKGAEHESNIVPSSSPPFGEHRLLPPGHGLKVKEFTVSLFLPDNDFSYAKGHFFGIDPGAYKFHCELELPGFAATGEGGKQLTPAAGEWSGKLTTRGLNVVVVAPDAPAPKPRIEHADVNVEKDGTLYLNRKKVTLDELKALAAKDAK